MRGSDDMTMQDFEDRLSAGLERIAAEAEIPTVSAADVAGGVVNGDIGTRSLGRRNGAWLLAAAAAVIAATVGIVLVAADSTPQEVATGNEQASDLVTGQREPMTIERFALNETVADLRLTATVDSAELGEPDAIFEHQVYGIAGDDIPEPGAARVTVFRVSGPLAPPLVGDRVAVGKRNGVMESDGTVGFEEGGATIRVSASGTDTDPVELASALLIDEDGQMQPLTGLPAGYTLLGSVRSGLHSNLTRSIPIEGHAALYDGEDGRWLTVSSEPSSPNDLAALAWLSESAASAQLGNRSVVTTIDGDLRSAAWVEDGSLVRALGYKLSFDEIEQVVSATGAVDEWPDTGPTDGPRQVAEAPADTADLNGAERVLATVVPDGFALILAADNVDMGEPWYSARTYVWASETTDEPTAEDASVIMTFTGLVPPFPGEAIDIAGAPGILIDKEATNAASDLFVTHLGGTATFAGNNVPVDDLVALAGAWVESGESEPPTELTNGMVRKTFADGAGWQGYGGPSGISGTPLGTTTVYQDEADQSRVLGVASSPIDGSGGVDYVRWTFPDAVNSVDVGGQAALAFEPVPGYVAVRFTSGDRLIVVWGENLSLEELLPTAQALRPAAEDEWNLGL